ncbi:MAG TPA: peptidylprolyl isomerase [Polyangiales bacterium]
MRKTVQNIGLLVIVVALSAVFLLEFGNRQSQGCVAEGGAKYAAQVYGETITLGEMKAAYIMANGTRYTTQAAREMRLKELILQGLIERNLLAREAEKVGYKVTQDDVMLRLAQDGVLYVSAPIGAPSSIPNGPVPLSFADEKGEFNLENARRFIQNRLGRTIEEFAKSQIRETLAERMRETISAAVTISPNEVWDAYVREKDKAEIKYVRFDNAFYKQQVTPTAADVDAYLKAHDADINAEFEREKHRYTGLEKQVRARHILFKADTTEPAADAGVSDPTKLAAKAAAKAKAEAARQRALKGEDFAKLALSLSEDTGSAREGGDLGYNTKGKMVVPFDDAQFALKPGEISQVVESRFGYHVIKVEGVREGDVPVEEAKREIAQKQLVDTRAGELAKAAAAQTLAELRQGTTLEQLEASLKSEKDAGGDHALAPVLREARPFGRGGSPIAGADNGELVKAAFSASLEKPLPEEPIKVSDSYVVFKLITRDEPKKEEFAGAEEQRLSDALLRRKRAEVLDQFVYKLRLAAEKGGDVRVNPEAIRYTAGEETASL